MEIKKRFLTVLAYMLVFTLASAAAVFAAPAPVKVTAYQGIKIIYNGKELSGTNQPYIINNVTYVPFRLLVESFGKNVTWDAANYKVVITDNGISADEKLQMSNQIADLQNKNSELQKTITTLNAKIATLESGSNSSTSDIKEALEDAFEDAGDDYFDDKDIEFTFSISGDKEDLAYTIKMDFDDSDEYEGITKVSDNDIEDFLERVESKIESEIKNTNFKSADITGKLVDSDDSSDYVKYNGSKYTYSWDGNDDLSDIEEEVIDYFKDKDVGEYYFDDKDVEVDISLDGDDDEIEYNVKIDCSDSDFDDIKDISTTKLRNFLNALRSKITTEIDNSAFEDADITGVTYDKNHTSYKVQLDKNQKYTYSWSD